ncbi:MAG: 4-(cytidine 5'-diphospho)-2-C-methyl-D-erythritol kinase [Gudongella sp.]|nr:4-(cytidine 5'-diphospho)-2-C-methyl-D-erythritol kinase [Gudongella sp.]
MKLQLDSHAKINLSLDVVRKREDGYHEIKSIMQQIDLRDLLSIGENKNGVIITCDNEQVPVGDSNLVYKAWEEISKLLKTNIGIRVDIKKKIPVAAGLAGGSTNCATTLKALNRMWDIGLSEQELMEIGIKIGADVPYCLMGGTALAEGIGEKLTKLRSFKDKSVLIANPGIQISTAYAYSKLKLGYRVDTIKELLECMENDDIQCLSKRMYNVMEDTIIPEHPQIGKIKEMMLENGALGSLMSGSGASVFGLYEDLDYLKFAEKKLREQVPFVFSAKTI